MTSQALTPYWGTAWPAGEREQRLGGGRETDREPEIYQGRPDGQIPKA